MINKVGDNVPASAVLAALLTSLRAVVLQLRAFCITLSTEDRKRVLHPRRGAEPMMLLTADLATKYNVAIPGAPLQGMRNDMALASALRPFVAELTAGTALAEHTITEAEYEAWEAFLAYYSSLSGMAVHLPDLALELEPVVKFMANGPRKKPEGEGTPPAPANPGGGTTPKP